MMTCEILTQTPDKTLDSLSEHLFHHSIIHPDFSYIIENHIDNNIIKVKTLRLEECAN